MKIFTPRASILATASLFFGLFASALPTPPAGPGTVNYNPDAKIIQGNQPLAQSYPLSFSSPGNLTAGVPVTITLEKSILSKPATVSDAATLSFLSFSTPTITFTGPNQPVTITVTVDVPLGEFAGNYAYLVKPAGWPSGLVITDEGFTVNALVSPASSTDTSPPAVVLQTPADGTEYTYNPVIGIPVSVPVTFDGSVGANGSPITGMTATINNNPVTLSTIGQNTLNASSTGTVLLTTPGTYEIKVQATNLNGTSVDTADITVVLSAPPPTIAVASPSVNAAYSYLEGEAGASVSVSYTATSQYGNITATGATLNGAPITLNLSGVGTSLTAVGSANFTLTAGDYVLGFTASNEFGAASPVSVPFTVESVVPIPSVSILTPVAGTDFARTVGDPATVVDFTFTGGTTGGLIESVTVTLDGMVVSSTVVDLGTESITGSGSASFTEGGTHTLSVTVSNGQATATDVTNFTVTESSGEVCQNLTWLPPISLNKTIEGGSTMPIKFRLDCNGEFVRDTTTLIAIYEIFADESISEPVIYPYGFGSPNPTDYAITGHMYHLNFATAEGVHRYKIEVFHPLNAEGTSLQLLGSKELLTKVGKKSDKSKKSKKSYKSEKSSKSDKSGKSGKSDKSSKSQK